MDKDAAGPAGSAVMSAAAPEETGPSTLAEADAMALSGSRSELFAGRLVQQVALCQWLPADEAGRDYRTATAMAALKELAPRNAMEGMLAGQMVAAHNVGLKLMTQAFRGEQEMKTIEAFLRQGMRAMALFARQTELMTRQRGRQRQSLRIEHEQVRDDGRVSVTAEQERVQ
jgi:hypothetical protein